MCSLPLDSEFHITLLQVKWGCSKNDETSHMVIWSWHPGNSEEDNSRDLLSVESLVLNWNAVTWRLRTSLVLYKTEPISLVQCSISVGYLVFTFKSFLIAMYALYLVLSFIQTMSFEDITFTPTQFSTLASLLSFTSSFLRWISQEQRENVCVCKVREKLAHCNFSSIQYFQDLK